MKEKEEESDMDQTDYLVPGFPVYGLVFPFVDQLSFRVALGFV
jgi:hypothetical protein